MARGLERRVDRVLQLLQDHRQGYGAGQALGEGRKRGAGFAGRAAESRSKQSTGVGKSGVRIRELLSVNVCGGKLHRWALASCAPQAVL